MVFKVLELDEPSSEESAEKEEGLNLNSQVL